MRELQELKQILQAHKDELAREYGVAECNK
jgi:hypothetical protein